MSEHGPGPGGKYAVTPWGVVGASEAEKHEGPKMVVPDAQAIVMRCASGRPHGSCSHFDLKEGQDSIHSQDFFNKIVKGELSDGLYREEWFEKHTGYGFCQLIGNDTLIHALHPGTCTLDQAQSWGHNSQVSWQGGGHKIVLCPRWEPRSAQAGKGDRRR